MKSYVVKYKNSKIKDSERRFYLYDYKNFVTETFKNTVQLWELVCIIKSKKRMRNKAGFCLLGKKYYVGLRLLALQGWEDLSIFKKVEIFFVFFVRSNFFKKILKHINLIYWCNCNSAFYSLPILLNFILERKNTCLFFLHCYYLK